MRKGANRIVRVGWLGWLAIVFFPGAEDVGDIKPTPAAPFGAVKYALVEIVTDRAVAHKEHLFEGDFVYPVFAAGVG